MTKIWEAIARIPSGSHNAPCDENGHHWPEGQRFKMLSPAKQKFFKQLYGVDRTWLVQIGGEEVVIALPEKMVKELLRPVESVKLTQSLVQEILGALKASEFHYRYRDEHKSADYLLDLREKLEKEIEKYA